MTDTDEPAVLRDAEDRPVFEIGLAMAGAISAGAYSCGVIDFLLEALDAIEAVRAGGPFCEAAKALRANLPDEAPVIEVPHRVRIKAMTGTSAGAMVAAIATTAFGGPIPPVRGATVPGEATGNLLYDSWVDAIHIDPLLGTSDLKAYEPARALLDGSILNTIAQNAVAHGQNKNVVRAYLAEELTVHLCLGNMRGVTYALRLDAGNSHQMSLHADVLSFCLMKTPPAAGATLHDLHVLTHGTTENWSLLGDAALASGAFPMALPARPLHRSFSDYEKRLWYIPSAPTSANSIATDVAMEIPPVHNAKNFPSGYRFVSVDGGVFNNEPLELCRRALAGTQRNPRALNEAKRSVILIDPFPDILDDRAAYDVDANSTLVSVAKNLLGVMVQQARFKPEELALAQNTSVASRHAILPERDDPKTKLPSTTPIACGLLGGFSGFLSREFRHHDFMLGRRNCQRFLLRHFVLAADEGQAFVNPIMTPWLNDPSHTSFMFENKEAISGREKLKVLPIIPLLGKLASPAYTAMPDWPAAPADLNSEALKTRITTRLNAVVKQLIDEDIDSCCQRLFARLAWRLARGSILNDIMKKIHAALRSADITVS